MPPLGFGLYRGRKSPKASTTRIEQDISAMVKRTSNKHQIAQFWKTVQLALKEKPRKLVICAFGICNSIRIRREGDIETRLQYVVSGVKTKIDAVSVDGQPHRESCRIILQSGSEEVRSILVKNGKSPRKIQKMIGEEKEAIQEDKKLDENLVRNTSTVQPKSDWTIYFMDEPQREPHLPETKLHGYNDVMRYLNIEEIIKSPELWIKCSDGNFQTFTSSRSCWIYVKPSESVGEMVLYVVDMQKRTHDTYLVALVHEGDDNEFPVPIG
ncbi:hypothetical protein FRC17_010242 [Serendipita sp. 399]|nr:hypothetical protein FRC17_010242 [Serendipita sp. 399]